jgi:diketogulonate reductase-like aldo/keto reductase
MGLGTGGLRVETGQAHEVITQALHIGYRNLDLAREYGTESIVSNVLSDRVPLTDRQQSQLTKAGGAVSELAFPFRSQLFITTKVWPTDLGFGPTSFAIDTSLNELRSNYADAYLLHWPKCSPEVEWMHCQTTVDPEGTWQQSWRALEKAYSEGKVQSIGVSNFDVVHLDELLTFANVKPHVVQNFAAIGLEGGADTQLDLDVRRSEDGVSEMG